MRRLFAAVVLCIMLYLLPFPMLIATKKRGASEPPANDRYLAGEREANIEYEALPEKESETVTEEVKQPVIAPLDDELIIEVGIDGEVEEMMLGEYIVGVVAAEMSASFDIEALKAQAVAARTNAIYKMLLREEHPESAPHSDCDICGESTHCQAYADEAKRREKWDTKYEEYDKKVRNAIVSTDGEIISYKGKPISAIYHSISGGVTEAAVSVWGNDIPYLVSVNSEWDENAGKYTEEKVFLADELKAIFESEYKDSDMDFDKPYTEWITDIKRSDAGGIISLKVAGKELEGRKFRNLLSLRSTNIKFEPSDQAFKITTRGYGHGVGMSQYGAGAMAEEGYTYTEILGYYYVGTECGLYTRDS